MPLDPVVATNLSNESRKQELRAKVARLRGAIDALSGQAQAISVQSNDTSQRLSNAQSELTALEQGSGPGVTDDFGPYSTTDQALQKERYAGKAALVDYIKANPTCLEADADAQWRVAALGARPSTRKWLLHDPLALRQEYSANLVASGIVADMTWASFVAWVVATPRDTILGM